MHNLIIIQMIILFFTGKSPLCLPPPIPINNYKIINLEILQIENNLLLKIPVQSIQTRFFFLEKWKSERNFRLFAYKMKFLILNLYRCNLQIVNLGICCSTIRNGF